MKKTLSLLSILTLSILAILYSCSRNSDDELQIDNKVESILSLNPKQLALKHNEILRKLAAVSSPEAKVYSTKEQIYNDLMAADINLDSQTRIQVYDYIDKHSDVNDNMNSVIRQLNTVQAKDLYLELNNQIESSADYESILSVLDRNSANILSISNDFDRQVLEIFVETCRASANYWYVEVVNNGKITIAGKTAPAWVRKDGNGIAQASVGWAVGAAIFGGGPASYFVACGVGGALASIWP